VTSALTDQGPYEFSVSGAGDDYIYLANTYMFVEEQTVADDNTALECFYVCSVRVQAGGW
jgi:hypothetical protein